MGKRRHPHQVGALHSFDAESQLARSVAEGSTALGKLTAALRYIQNRDLIERHLMRRSAKQQPANGAHAGHGRLLFDRSAAQCNTARVG